jgi:glycosyltransferase involved in cell wall biosynthesis
MTISVLLLTLNEEINIRRCIESLSNCDDIIVIDSFSQDDTVLIAKSMGAKVFQRVFDDFAGQRNFAIEQVDFKYEWILHLDADEVMTTDLYNEMLIAVDSGHFDAYYIPSKVMLFGRWLRHAGMYPSYQVRLGHRRCFRFRQVGHGQREDINSDRIGTLRNPYLHNSFSKGFSDWFEKHNRYSSMEANALIHDMNWKLNWDLLLIRDPVKRRRFFKQLAYRLPGRPLLVFFYLYIARLGLLDGKPGLIYCLLRMVYEFMIDLKVMEIREGWMSDGRLRKG